MTDQPSVVDLRRDLHAHPELGFTEYATAALVMQRLTELGWSVSTGPEVMDPALRMGLPSQEQLDTAWADAVTWGVPATFLEPLRDGMTAVVGTLTGRRPGRVVAIRADLDALPVQESRAASHPPRALGFASTRPGLMHACGHDGHVAIALDLAARLADRDFAGTVKLVFQPAEEGLRGGRAVAASGILDDVDDVICIHLGVGVPTGAISPDTRGLVGVREAAGRRSTAPRRTPGRPPERGRSALLAAAAATLAVHTLPQHGSASVRANVGSLHAEGASNVVPSHAVMTLEVRADESQACEDLRARVVQALQGSAATYGVECTVDLIGQAPAVVSDESLAQQLADLAEQVPSVREVWRAAPDNGSDDASWLIDRVRALGGRGAYVLIGSTPEIGHHESTFDLDEHALEIGSDLLLAAVQVLGRTAPSVGQSAGSLSCRAPSATACGPAGRRCRA
ncbi:amidohydrolase [Aeromicrobium sp. UC242_57]|uniref:amidohydrolase n=1 Tax=Aeromicrobium sp. UC242_57 TaxID=3374624 RepID=UPI0037BDC6AF